MNAIRTTIIGRLGAAVAFVLSLGTAAQAAETLNIQNYAGTTGNMHAIVAAKKGLCEKHGFTCEIKTINSGTLGLQALVGKTIDVSQTGTELAAATLAAGGDVVIVGISIPNNVLSVSVRSDVPLPHRAQGYPAIMQDFKGLKIGPTARGSGGEAIFNAMLREAGMQPGDVTYVAVGGPSTAYTSLVVGRQVDAVVLFEPLKQLCLFNKTCTTAIDMTQGEGPQAIRDMNGAAVPFVMRREMVERDPKIVAAFIAAMRDAARWFNEPANFDELVAIFTPLVSFGDMPGADELRRSWIKSVLPAYSADLAVRRSSVQAIIDFYRASGTIDKPVDPAKLVWDKAP